MKINYKKLDDSKKLVQFLEGIFPLETDKKFFWVWTSTKVYGIVSNVKSITIKAFSEIDNVLLYDDKESEIKSDCLNIINLNMTDKNEFLFELKNEFTVVNDDRVLGIRIIGILVDDEVIFP
jgi:hypothetical protein